MTKFATISRNYRFEAAHSIPGLPPHHKCARVHGHSYLVELRISGELDSIGFVEGIDFGALDLVMEQLLKLLDHQTLNDVPGLEQPTVENIAWWLVDMVGKALGRAVAVRVYEGGLGGMPRSWAEAK
jgi:6-pyruvoyltetrahydropterin/6-carboxytetrahydropterin synthase